DFRLIFSPSISCVFVEITHPSIGIRARLIHSISHPGTDTSSLVNHNAYMASSSASQIAYAQLDQQSSEYPPPEAGLVVALMANLSYYGSDNLAEVNNHNYIPNHLIPQEMQVSLTFEQSTILAQSDTENGILKDATPRVDAAKKVVSPSMVEEFAVKESPEVNTSDLGSNPPLPLQEANLAGNAPGKPSYANATERIPPVIVFILPYPCVDDPLQDRIEEFFQHQEDPWDDPLPHEYVALASKLTKPTLDDRLKRAHQQLSYRTIPTHLRYLKNDEDEKLLNIFKQIHINLPFLEAMINMPKGAKNGLPPKEGDPGSFTLPCLIRPLAVKNALADLERSINLMPYSLFCKLGISELKHTKMSIQLANHFLKYPIAVCENLGITWSITDIKGIDSSICTHKILMEDEYKPTVQSQRRVNLNIKEVVKKEVIKLPDVRLIYPISDSPWVLGAGIEVNKAKIDSIAKLPQPTNVKAIQSFLGHEGFYRRDMFPKEKPMSISSQGNEPWYTDYANCLASRVLPVKLAAKKNKNSLVISNTTFGMSRTYSNNVPIRSFGDVSQERRHPKFLDNVTVVHLVDTTGLPRLHKKFTRLTCNMDLDRAGENRFLQINELDELRLEAYESSVSYKDKTKRWHDKRINPTMQYEKGDKVLLFNSQLRLSLGKLKS
nr:hypothetical protein [Tanacetum cinerariifolium]